MSLRLFAVPFLAVLMAAWAQTPQINVASATSKRVQLTWTATAGATSYSVYRTPTTVTSSGLPGDQLQISSAPQG